jgi:hypothetical protein
MIFHNFPLPKKLYQKLAGAEGFEPSNGGSKGRCLTIWLRPNNPTIILTLVLYSKLIFEDRQKSFLRNINVSNCFHPLFAFFLFFQKFPLPGNISSITFG